MFDLFDFKDAAEVLKLVVTWVMLCAALPIFWWLLHGELIGLQMVRSVEGWLYLGGCYLAALVMRPMVNRIGTPK